MGDFPGDPVVKNLSGNAGQKDSISGQGTKIPHALEQLNPPATTKKIPGDAVNILCVTTKTQHSQVNK